MLLTDSHSIREIIAFHLMSSRDSDAQGGENEAAGDSGDTES